MTEVNIKANPMVPESKLQQISCIYYSTQFGLYTIKIIIDFGNNANAIWQSFMKKIALCLQKINVSTKKIDSSPFETFEMVIVSFLVNKQIKSLTFLKKHSYWLILAYILLLEYFSLFLVMFKSISFIKSLDRGCILPQKSCLLLSRLS